MNDQGEKIVLLAQEILNAGAGHDYFPKFRPRLSPGFKTICLTTLLALASGSLATEWLHRDERPLNQYEKFELQALVFYISKLKGMDETAICHEVEQRLGIFSLDQMTEGDFAIARRYLQKKAQ